MDRVLQRTTGPHPGLLADELRQQLTDLVKKVRSTHPVQVEVAVGVPFITVIERVLTAGHDLLIITDDGPDSPMASMTKHLLRKCPCPVWVMRPSRARRHRVLAAIDPEPESAEAEMNRLILDLATSHAELTDAELHVAHAWNLYGESALRTSPFLGVSCREVDELLEQTREGHRRRLEESLARYDISGLEHQVHLEEGEPGDVIPDLTKKHRITLLVMGTVGRTGVPGLIMGSNAERILDRVQCSVLAVKPEGFVSPVESGHRRRASHASQ